MSDPADPDTPVRRPRGRLLRAALVLLLLLPLIAGAALAASGLAHRAPAGPQRVALVDLAAPDQAGAPAPASAPGVPANSTGAALVGALRRSPDFAWQPATLPAARAALADGSVLAAVLVPAEFGAGTAPQDGPAEQIVVVQGSSGSADDYTKLVRAVSARAGEAGVKDLLVRLSAARIDLNVAELTAVGLKGGVAQAEGIFNDALGTVDQLIEQSDPLIDGARGLLAGLQENAVTLVSIEQTLGTLADSVSGIGLTVADLRNGVQTAGQGLDAARTALRDTAAVRARIRDAVRPLTAAAATTGIPEVQSVAAQLDGLVNLLGGDSDARLDSQLGGASAATDVLSGQLNDLSSLVGAPVADSDQISDVLRRGVDRLRSVGDLLRSGNDLIDRVIGQLGQAKEKLPGIKTNIRAQLDRFKAVTAQLGDTMHQGLGKLPEQSSTLPAAIGDAVAVQSAPQSPTGPAPGPAAAASFLAAGALALVVGAGRLRSVRRVPGWVVAGLAVLGGLGLAAGAILMLGPAGRTLAGAGLVALATVAAIGWTVGVLRVFGAAGTVVVAGVLGASTLLYRFMGGLHPRSPSEIAAALLPTDYATIGMAAAGRTTAGEWVLAVSVLLGLAVFGAVAALVARRRWTGDPAREFVSRS